MSFLNKAELKKQLRDLGIKVQGNYVRKRDIEKLVFAVHYTMLLKYKGKLYTIHQTNYKKGQEIFYVDLGDKHNVFDVDYPDNLKIVNRVEKDFGNEFESTYELKKDVLRPIPKSDLVDGGRGY